MKKSYKSSYMHFNLCDYMKSAWIPIVLLWIGLVTFAYPGHPWAETIRTNREIVRVEAFCSNASVHRGGAFRVAVRARIKDGLHINSHRPEDSFLVPTIVTFHEVKGITFGPVSYPTPIHKNFSFSEKPMPVYEGATSFMAGARTAEDMPLGNLTISGAVSYQACDDESCFAPESQDFKISLTVVDKHQPAELINQRVFEKEVYPLSRDELRARQVIEKGFLYSLAAFFIFGLALNLTPCVYPVIPLTVGFFGTRDSRKKTETLILAIYYVLGIAFVFSLLGLLSGLAGRQWGFLFQNPWFVIAISIIILSMAASMFGAFEITVPSFIMTRAGKARHGAMGSLVMGLTAGVVIAPCAAGIVIGLVGIIAKLGLVVKGTLLFFTMGMGLGLPYLFLALFSGMMNNLPQAGMWMVWIRKFFGILLIGVAFYFLIPQAKQVSDQTGFYFGVLGIFGGLLLGFLDHNPGYTKGFKIFRSVVGCGIIVLGMGLVNGALHYQEYQIDWISYDKGVIKELREKDTPLLIDFYADWCAACRELDAKTFTDEDVAALAQRFSMVRVDCTAPSPALRNIMERFRVSGLPTVVFLNKEGKELRNLRVIGFVEGDDMEERMKDTLSADISTDISPDISPGISTDRGHRGHRSSRKDDGR